MPAHPHPQETTLVTTARAALSVALLCGFYGYAFGLIAASAAVTVILTGYGLGALVTKLALVTLAMTGAICYATWKVLRARRAPMPGLVLPEQWAPRLWGTVRELAGAVATRPPDEIRLIADADAGVSEDARLLGLRGGRRYLYVGVPLLQAMTVGQVRSVLAHELGHYSRRHTRLGELTQRGRVVMEQTITQVGPTSPAGWLLRGYAALYQWVSAAVSRRQEIEADRAAARVTGPATAASALRELPVLGAAWEFYLSNYVNWGLDSGYAPTGVLAHFPSLLQARAGELAEIRAHGGPERRSPWDSHPPTAARIALTERTPAGPVPVDNRPAGVLVGDLPGAAAALEAEVLHFDGRTRVSFPDYTAAAMQWLTRRDADILYRAAARLPGPGGRDLPTVLRLLDTGRVDELKRAALRPIELADPVAADELFRSYIYAALAALAVPAGAARWRHSWSGPAILVTWNGEPFDLDWPVAAAAAGRAADVREWLTGWGVDTTAATADEHTATATGAAAIAGIVNAKVGRDRRDLVILTTGLVIMPGIARLKMRRAKHRMRTMLTQTPPAHLAGAPGHRFLPYEEIAASRMVRRVPVTYELVLHSGERLRIRWGGESEQVGPGWEALSQAVTHLTPTP